MTNLHPTESSTVSVKPLSDVAPPEHGPPVSSSDAEDQLSPVSPESEPDESPTVASLTTDDGECTHLETVENWKMANRTALQKATRATQFHRKERAGHAESAVGEVDSSIMWRLIDSNHHLSARN